MAESGFAKMLFKCLRHGRGLQFRLRTLLLATLAIALLFPLVVFPAQSQRRSREWVLSQRGRVVLNPDFDLKGSWYVGKGAWPLPKLIVETLGIDMFASARIVVLDCDEIYDLSGIKGLGRLEELYIYQFVHDAKTFDNLKNLRYLKKLRLTEWAGLSNDEIAAIMKSLPDVEVDADEKHRSGSKTTRKYQAKKDSSSEL